MTPLEQAKAIIAKILEQPEPLVARDDEPAFLEILDIVKSSPDSRQEFVDLFVRMVHGVEPSPTWLVSFLMVPLRWPEILSAAKEEAKLRPTHNYSQAFDLLDVYADDWRGHLLFDSFKPEGGGRR